MTKTPRVALIGTGRIGTHHAHTIHREVPDLDLTVLADPAEGVAQRLADALGVPAATTDPLAAATSDDVDAVVITTPARTHVDLVSAALGAGKHVFVEKPLALTLDDNDRVTAQAAAAGRVLQVGFNRRYDPGFAAARKAIADGVIGDVQLLRSVTRDPGPFSADPTRVPQWTIFYETLIHDFDLLNFFNPGARAVNVFARADALVVPDRRDLGFLDTALVSIRYDNGAFATAEANFSALYGYDVRGEAFGSKGMVTAGDARLTSMTAHVADGINVTTGRSDTELMHSSYLGEFQTFARAVVDPGQPHPTGVDNRRSLEIALACIRSVEESRPVDISEVTS
ncbi:MAG: Gfo/Idh/MocA family oxidoreductase [Propionibacteriaceae bacterium]|nr:Gfo/Idh/MocA family oxidoreductase [Propionibacteriaceae bacterium]